MGEVAEGRLAEPTRQAIAATQALESSFSMVLASSALGGAPAEALALGAAAVYTAEEPSLAEASPETMVAVAEQAVRQMTPWAVFGTGTPFAKEVLPRLAFRLGTALAQDCIRLARDSQGRLLVTRPVYGGNVLATIACLGTPAVASLRLGVFDTPGPASQRGGQVLPLALHPSQLESRTKLTERVEQPGEGIRLEDARVVVAGGRGLGGAEGFQQLEELAGLLHGAVGASGAACAAEWASAGAQIGLTGKTITPDLYVAVGISGASQHLAGCNGAKHIVAINLDADANIYKTAQFGVVGDWRKVLPGFIEQVRALLQ
jgi:electron transfer flavoprotein alpha subunit